ncbi:MAG: transcriptional activator NhaR [Oceanospirillaceae bacterium]|uniref:transcriptional activator NhaR n=1 Tax=unclassified Thalassolituus TaxID=2624967 RepID=UPI000C3DD572|nr:MULTISPECIES: transcriptional activator NhaR [unclassified Thalassolituus]MBS51532.1 transcriptional activator NhaR [Oceanospirillaceae bacterium]|tara:strand:- start:93 stop:983 length:891 start_codon:yes stop_codon:yes gene_type:complete
MKRLNYKHLQYFHCVAEEGSVLAAARRLNVTPQTISGQLRLLEDELGNQLFAKAGRGLELTDAGRVALDYTREMFRLGDELQEVMLQETTERPLEFRVGIVDALPKSIAHRLLAPALSGSGFMRIICHEEQMSVLLGELAVHRLDLVLADSPIPSGMNVRCFSHPLGRSTMACFAAPALVQQFSPDFPQCLRDAPLLLPTDTASGLRTELLSWLDRMDISMRISGEFDDSALLQAFGGEGHGFFFAPSAIREEICAKYDVTCVGEVDELVQEFYAVSAERKISHKAVKLITEHAAL